LEELQKYIRTIYDFPKPGIGFKDITSLTRDANGFKLAIDEMVDKLSSLEVDLILGIESRGFIFGGAVANRMGVGFDLIRKPGKLPGKTISESYQLEYGMDSIEIHADAVTEGTNVVILDDLLATGGTMSAALNLVKKLGGNIVALLFLIELDFLSGRDKLKGENVITLINYNSE